MSKIKYVVCNAAGERVYECDTLDEAKKYMSVSTERVNLLIDEISDITESAMARCNEMCARFLREKRDD